jgi:tetratricopeptide (TPR) repeat protein
LYYLKRAEHAAALQNFGKASALDPFPSLPYSKASETCFALYVSSKNPEYLQSAIDRGSKAIALFPTNARYWSDIAWLYRMAGEKERALHAITRAAVYDRYNPNYRYARRLLLDGR